MTKDILFLQDIFVGPITLLVLYFLAYSWRNRYYRGSEIAKYFMPAWTVRVIGAFGVACLYQFYYGGGDTTMYFRTITQIRQVFLIDAFSGLEILFRNFENLSDQSLNYLNLYIFSERNLGMFSGETAFLVKTGAFLSIFTNNSYLGISFIITFFAFAGCWRLFLVFYDMFPKMHLYAAIATLFIPSVFFWGSALLKDSLVIGATGFFTYGLYYLLIKREKVIPSLFLVLFMGFIVAKIKLYVIIGLAPAFFVWAALDFIKKIDSKITQTILGPFIIGLSMVMGVFSITQLGRLNPEYDINNMLETVVINQNYIRRVNETKGGAGYDLGRMQPTIQSALTFFPKGVNVTLFRPYLWEARSLINLIAGMESLITLLLTLYVFFRIGLIQTFRTMYQNPFVLFCLTFALIFAFAVGISTYNFGSLSRYKIPCLPFYFMGLFALLHLNDKTIRRSIFNF